MELSEISAVLGIDVEKEPWIVIAGRAAEFCAEMAECYEEGSLDSNAFEALGYVLNCLAGGAC